MNTADLKTDVWRSVNPSPSMIRYDEPLDTLFIDFTEKETERLITHFVDDNVAFLYRHSDKEIVGIKVEYFKKEFLDKVAENTWKLSQTNEKLDGFLDFEMGFTEKKVVTAPFPSTTGQFTIPKTGKRLKLKPVYA